MLMLLGGVVLDHQQPLAPRRGVLLDARRARRRRPPVVVGLVTKREGAAGQRVLAVLVQRHDLHRDVARSADPA